MAAPYSSILSMLTNISRRYTRSPIPSWAMFKHERIKKKMDFNSKFHSPKKLYSSIIVWNIVLTNMIHGPCGAYNPHSACMENETCTKCFPKPFKSRTIVDVDTSHPVYQHRSPEEGGGSTLKDGKNIDNSWVVPYNPFLSLRFNCHINVEICIFPLA